jgi:hypothetical protein
LSDIVPVNRSKRIDNSLHHLLRTQDSITYDIFCFSNSYIYTAIDPLFLEHLTGLKSLNFCSDAQRTIFTLETMRYILTYYHPKCIILDLSKPSTFLPEDRKNWSINIQGILSSDVSAKEIVRLVRLAPGPEKKNIFFEGYSQFTASLKNLYKWQDYSLRPRYAEVPGYLGYYPLLKQKEDMKTMENEKFNKIYNDTARGDQKLFDEISRKEFFNFFDEFSNEGIKVIFISSLKLNSSSESGFDSIGDRLRRMSPGNYFTINLNDEETKRELALAKDDFSDPNHMTHRGALKITELVAPVIRNIVLTDSMSFITEHSKSCFTYKSVICDYNLIIEDYYQKVLQLYLDTVPLDYEDSNLVISVFPKEEILNHLPEESKEKGAEPDLTYLNRNDFIRTNKGIITATIYLNTKLKKDQIDKIEISSRNSHYMPENNKVIYRFKD